MLIHHFAFIDKDGIGNSFNNTKERDEYCKQQENMLKDLGMYLLHRFGDVFAHFNMKNDVKEVDERNITPVSLNEYPNCLKSFFDSNLVVNVPRNESKQISLKEDGVYFINGKFYFYCVKLIFFSSFFFFRFFFIF